MEQGQPEQKIAESYDTTRRVLLTSETVSLREVDAYLNAAQQYHTLRVRSQIYARSNLEHTIFRLYDSAASSGSMKLKSRALRAEAGRMRVSLVAGNHSDVSAETVSGDAKRLDEISRWLEKQKTDGRG